jgi:hypothetical protein
MVSLFTYADGTQVFTKRRMSYAFTRFVLKFSYFSDGVTIFVFSLVLTFNNTIEPGYNDIGLCHTSFIASDILWYQLIPHC